MPKNLSAEARFAVFLSALTIIALAFILIATSKYGAGVSSDAARNLSTADSLLEGKGFVDMVGAPLILWPPLYPLLLAAISWVTKWTTFQSAWYLNVVLYVANVWLAGWLLYQVFRSRLSYAVIGALIILASRSTLRIHANVASEPLFETLLLVFFLVTARYLRMGSRRDLWAMCVLAALASLQRYLGVVLIPVILGVLYLKAGPGGLLRGVLPIFTAVLPLALWVALHNYGVSGTLFGPRELGTMLPFENIELSLTKIIWWFVPRVTYLDWIVLRPWLPLALLAALLIGINRRQAWAGWLRELAGEHLWPGLLFSVLYFLLLAFTVVTADHLDLTSDRYYVVILPFVVGFIFVTFDTLILPHLGPSRPLVKYVMLGVAVVWFAYPLYSMQAYLREALVRGEPTNYNIANSQNFRELSLVKAAEPILARDPKALVYSNYLNIVWFIFHHPVEVLPFENAALPREQRLIALRENYPNWPEKAGYIVWFTPNQYHHIVAPDELLTIADLKLLYSDKTGQIYAVDAEPRAP